MLSPNATKRVTDNCGGAVTVTRNVQELARRVASIAVHVTVVSPTGKRVPFSGRHVVATGGWPLVVVAVPYMTLVGDPSSDCSVCESGHEITGGSGGVGRDGLEQPLQATAHAARPPATAPARICRKHGGSKRQYHPTLRALVV
jgi:hypothetical protein